MNAPPPKFMIALVVIVPGGVHVRVFRGYDGGVRENERSVRESDVVTQPGIIHTRWKQPSPVRPPCSRAE